MGRKRVRKNTKGSQNVGTFSQSQGATGYSVHGNKHSTMSWGRLQKPSMPPAWRHEAGSALTMGVLT